MQPASDDFRHSKSSSASTAWHKASTASSVAANDVFGDHNGLEATPLRSSHHRQCSDDSTIRNDSPVRLSQDSVFALATSRRPAFGPVRQPHASHSSHPPSKLACKHTNSHLSIIFRRFRISHRGKKGSPTTPVLSRGKFKAILVNLASSRGHRLFRRLFYWIPISESAETIRCVRAGEIEALKKLFTAGDAHPKQMTCDDWTLLHVSFCLAFPITTSTPLG